MRKIVDVLVVILENKKIKKSSKQKKRNKS